MLRNTAVALLRARQQTAPSISFEFASSRRTFSEPLPLPEPQQWTFEQVRELVSRSPSGDEDVVLMDVREPRELAVTGRIPGARLVPFLSAPDSFGVAEVDFRARHGFDRPPRSATLVFYCRSGVRAANAANAAAALGWRRVGIYAGSWIDWAARGGEAQR